MDHVSLMTSLAGQVRNTSLPKNHALLSLLKAIVNGIQAIDTRLEDSAVPNWVDMRAHRDAQAELDFGPAGPGRLPLKPIVGFIVEDDGVVHTAQNMPSFETLGQRLQVGPRLSRRRAAAVTQIRRQGVGPQRVRGGAYEE